MAVQAEGRTTPRVRLSRDLVLRAAIQIADQSGIEALTMRNLAQQLGVEAMTVYYYVAKKDDIVNGILELVVGEIEVPSTEATGGRHYVEARSQPTRSCCVTAGPAAS